MLRAWLLLCFLLIAACAPPPTATPPPPEPTEEASGLLAALVGDAPLPDERPAWQHIALIDARAGTEFSLASYAGRTVYVQPIAVGCGECFALQEQVSAARARLNPEQYVFISVSSEPAAALSAYADERGFAWQFAAAPIEFFTGLAETYGDTVTRFTAAPHFVISPLGAVSGLTLGWRSADQLIAELTAASGA